MAATNALQWLVKTQQQAVSRIVPLAGLTACSQLITLANGKRYVLREQSARATELGVNYQQEAYILTKIQPLAFAPKPIYADSEASLLTWIEGEVPSQFSLSLLEKLAVQLAKLHQFDRQAVKFSENFVPLDLAERCAFLWQQLPLEKQAKLPFSPPFSKVEPFAQALCHHDLHLANLIVQGEKLFLIDWEYAAVSDPALELALFFASNPLSDRQKDHFLQCYFAAAFPKNRQNLTACCAKMAEYQPLIAILTALWYEI